MKETFAQPSISSIGFLERQETDRRRAKRDTMDSLETACQEVEFGLDRLGEHMGVEETGNRPAGTMTRDQKGAARPIGVLFQEIAQPCRDGLDHGFGHFQKPGVAEIAWIVEKIRGLDGLGAQIDPPVADAKHTSPADGEHQRLLVVARDGLDHHRFGAESVVR